MTRRIKWDNVGNENVENDSGDDDDDEKSASSMSSKYRG